MKTGFICASGFNLVATATRGEQAADRGRAGSVVLGARAAKAAQLLERGFAANPLSWLMPSPSTVDQLVPVAASPPNLREDICGGNTAAAGRQRRRRKNADRGGKVSFFLSNLARRAPGPRS